MLASAKQEVDEYTSVLSLNKLCPIYIGIFPCSAKGCGRLPDPDAASKLTRTYTYEDAVVRYTCKDEYLLVGDSVLYCDGRAWSDKPPECVRE